MSTAATALQGDVARLVDEQLRAIVPIIVAAVVATLQLLEAAQMLRTPSEIPFRNLH